MSCCGLILHINDIVIKFAEFKNCKNINKYVSENCAELYEDNYKMTFKDLLQLRSSMEPIYNALTSYIDENLLDGFSSFYDIIDIEKYLKPYPTFSPLVEGNMPAKDFVELYRTLQQLETVICLNVVKNDTKECYIEWWVG